MSDLTINDQAASQRDVEFGAEAPPILFLHGIDRHYSQGDVVLDILKGAEFAIWPGQSVALVAPSGAGKSTLLHVAACWSIRTRARSISTRFRHPVSPMPSAHASGGSRSASSINSTIC